MKIDKCQLNSEKRKRNNKSMLCLWHVLTNKATTRWWKLGVGSWELGLLDIPNCQNQLHVYIFTPKHTINIDFYLILYLMSNNSTFVCNAPTPFQFIKKNQYL